MEPTVVRNYKDFLQSKEIKAGAVGLSVDGETISPVLFDFQQDIVRWALRLGRAAIFADCGLGKTLMQLEWARHIGGRVLIFAPLSVAEQTIREGRKLGLAVNHVRTSIEMRDGVNISNYEIAKKFIGTDLSGIVLDESSILKSVDGKTRKMMLEEFTSVPYRLCCTATPCPNDIAELANHSEFLGVMKRVEMLASFFVHDDEGWRLRGHASEGFYRWLASWAMALKNPADLGYDGSQFRLPDLAIRDVVIETEWRRPGHLFAGGLKGITDRSSVRKDSISDRVQSAANIANSSEDQFIVWCGLNDESSRVSKMITGAVEVSGADSSDDKVSKILGFLDGRHRVLVSKPKIAGFGMNFQHCHQMIFLGLGDSYESYYQCIRRSWRFGQTREVQVHIVVTDHEEEIVENVRRKEAQADELTNRIIESARKFEMEQLGKSESAEVMETAVHSGKNWTLYQGDCVEEMARIADESVDLSVFSPPFLALYTYSSTERDLGNCSSDVQFFEHFRYVIDGLLRITRPGRLCCVHTAQVCTTLNTHGVIGLRDFRGKVCEEFVSRGWVYHGEVCIDKDPQAQAIRTHSKGLLFVQLKKDSSWLRPALADYILVFRKPGDNAVPVRPDLANDEWIEWARPIWYGIRESDTLNVVEARSDEDDRHICPLQLGTIERCVRLWSNRGETVFSPFAGIGSEGYQSLKLGRKFIGCELKPLYARTAVRNLKSAESASTAKNLFSGIEEEVA